MACQFDAAHSDQNQLGAVIGFRGEDGCRLTGADDQFACGQLLSQFVGHCHALLVITDCSNASF